MTRFEPPQTPMEKIMAENERTGPTVSHTTSLEESPSPEAILAYKKEAEKTFIRTVYAPMKLSQSATVRDKYLAEIRDMAEETKTAIDTIIKQMDSSIKGKFSKKIKATVEDKAKGYDEI